MKTAEETFDDWARRGRDQGMETGHYPRAVQALERMALECGQRAIDLGCGNGWAARWMSAGLGEQGLTVGIDRSTVMLERARELSSKSTGVEFVRASFESLPFEDGYFDHAFSMEALYYAEDLASALSEVARVLSSGGDLWFCTDCYRENPYCHTWSSDLDVPMQLLSEAEWRSTLGKAGLTVEESFRALDPRPVDANLAAEEQKAQRTFREEIGTLVLHTRRREALSTP